MPAFIPHANVLQNHALQFATIAHGNQVRKGNEHIPYIFHCVDVANEVIYYSGLPTTELEVASVVALLHDTVEDTAVTVAHVRDQFGDVVADGVAALSKDDTMPDGSGGSKRTQLEENLIRIKAAPRFVQAVKLADRVSNLKSFPSMWDRGKVAHYLDESALIARELGSASEGLHARLLSRIADARVMLSLRS
jgi:(p)ppGpp synthase/HD superfamily hydrolase